ncbi:phosphoglycerate dehydrogenase [Fluviispira sanaruensis]|uniref:Phosphoglycerate dehydrogenase-like oxidoreductase n=1 Tax=Fluviispira sanaruensis TaxID=2493639 RepID=A0A4P2VPA9_FLUSA|nr:phosphoglycerate dehydrogenase [Fluviispira sanaruensis]BBH54064.1 phosphoglycerate dehydrogenase-like oxidoreductase [Fluviispira sanaruensis]
MNVINKIAVASRSFSRNELLRVEILKKYKDIKFNDEGKSLCGTDLINFLNGHDKAIIALERIDDYVLSKLPDLKVISKYGVGLNNLDFHSLAKFNINLGWIKGVNRRSVAELALSFALLLIRKSYEANIILKSMNWQQIVGYQLTGKVFGIIGCGCIGQDLIKLLKPFDCDIICYDILDELKNKVNNARFVSLEELLTCSDIISLHIPYSEKNHNFIDAKKLNLMKKTSIFINTSRGNLVDEAYLKEMLLSKKLLAAGFDVFAQEPFYESELLHLPNFFATPHIGGSSMEAIWAMGMAAIEGLEKNYSVDTFQSEWFI